MTRVCFLGDVHGCLDHMAYAIQTAAIDYECHCVIQLGDFGLNWPGSEGKAFTKEISRLLDTFNTPLFWIEGNHDNYDDLYSRAINASGMRQMKPRIFHIPRGHSFEVGGKRILGIGGAYSVDKDSRIPYVSWWPEELITYADIDRALQTPRPDIIVTHDCPEVVPYKLILPRGRYPIAEARSQRVLLDHVYDEFHPEWWLHGHYHRSYSWRSDDGTNFIGLSQEYTGRGSWTVLEWSDNGPITKIAP